MLYWNGVAMLRWSGNANATSLPLHQPRIKITTIHRLCWTPHITAILHPHLKLRRLTQHHMIRQWPKVLQLPVAGCDLGNGATTWLAMSCFGRCIWAYPTMERLHSKRMTLPRAVTSTTALHRVISLIDRNNSDK